MMADKPTYKVDMDEEDRETAAAQGLSRSALAGVLGKSEESVASSPAS